MQAIDLVGCVGCWVRTTHTGWKLYGLRENSSRTFENYFSIFTGSQSNDTSTILFTTREEKISLLTLRLSF